MKKLLATTFALISFAFAEGNMSESNMSTKACPTSTTCQCAKQCQCTKAMGKGCPSKIQACDKPKACDMNSTKKSKKAKKESNSSK